MKIVFSVKPTVDDESKKVTVEVTTDGVPEEWILQQALKARVITWQAAIRSNPEKFKDGLAKETLRLDEGIFEGTARMPSMSMEARFAGLDSEKQKELIEKLRAVMTEEG